MDSAADVVRGPFWAGTRERVEQTEPRTWRSLDEDGGYQTFLRDPSLCLSLTARFRAILVWSKCMPHGEIASQAAAMCTAQVQAKRAQEGDAGMQSDPKTV